VAILKPIVSIAVAGAVLASAYSHLSGDQRGKIASVEKTVFATVDSGISWLGATVAAWVPYRLPEVQPNGDIVIKHLSPEPSQPAEKGSPLDARPPAPAPTNT
jgi:hypothetical protein